MISQIRVDKAVFGVSAIHSSYGVSTTRTGLAEIKKLPVKCAKVRIALADHTKFGRRDFVHVGPVKDYDIIVTDEGTPASEVAALREQGVQVIVAGGSDGSHRVREAISEIESPSTLEPSLLASPYSS